MLYVNLRDGSALNLDLTSEEGRSAWRRLARDPREIRGVALGQDGRRADLPLPRRFRELAFEAEHLADPDGHPLAERISVLADGVVLTLTMHLNGREGRFRVDLDKRGRARFRPSYP